jgi:hypothetical protein
MNTNPKEQWSTPSIHDLKLYLANTESACLNGVHLPFTTPMGTQSGVICGGHIQGTSAS